MNRSLADRRIRFEKLFKSGDFFKLSESEKEKVSPEVHRIRWVPLRECVKNCLTSMVGNPPVYVDKYQEISFQKLNKKKKRDPMFITAAALMELESFPNTSSLVTWCAQVDLPTLTKYEQVLPQP